ncbi:MAG: hypothetical protein AAF618_12260 [Pseudomonadota bacterium]
MDAIPIDPDLMFVLGIVLTILCAPSLFSAWIDGRRPRASAITILIAIGMVGYASYVKPSGYPFGEIPNVVAEVLARYIL